MNLKPFERYDIRGKYPEELDEDFARSLGKAFAYLLNEKEEEEVAVTRDSKDSSRSLKEAFIEGMETSGIDVLDAGVGPSDYTALTGMENNCYSVHVTSSHLPMEYNGFKFMYPEGNSLVNNDLDQIRKFFRQSMEIEGKGSLTKVDKEAERNYIDKALNYLETLDLKPDKSVYIETLGGSGGELLSSILEELGINYHLSQEPRDPPDPDKHELRELEQAVSSGDYDIGIAFDMDADRAKVFTDEGWLTGDQVFAMIASAMDPATVVGSMNSSSRVKESFSGEFVETRVGDPFVLSEMLETGAEFGGEPNHHYAFRDFVPYSSGTMTGLVIASLDIEYLKQQLEKIEILKKSLEVKDKNRIIKEIKNNINSENVIALSQSGIKYRDDGAEILIRSSGTSQKIRITVYSSEKDLAEKALEETVSLIQQK